MKFPTIPNPIQHSDLFKFGQDLGSVSSPTSLDPIYTPIIARNGSASQFDDNGDSPLYYIPEEENYYEITCKKKRSRLRKLYLALIKLGYLRSALKKTVKRQRRNA